jgi:hypothetical protein
VYYARASDGTDGEISFGETTALRRKRKHKLRQSQRIQPRRSETRNQPKGKISGEIEGFIMSTREILMKPDRTSEVTIRSTNLSNGETVFALEKDTGKIVDPTPTGKIEGNLTFQTPSQNLAYLNQTKGWTEAIYNIATGEYTFKVYTQK